MRKLFIAILKQASLLVGKLAFIAIALYLVLRKIDVVDIAAAMLLADPVYLIFAFGISNVSLTFSALRSRKYFAHFGLEMSKKFAICIYYIGTFFNIILPGGISGDGYKIYILSKSRHFSKITSLRVMLYERVNGFYILSIMGFILLYFSHFTSIPYATLINTALLIAITPCYFLGIKYILKDQYQAALEGCMYSVVVQSLQIVMALFIILSLQIDFTSPQIMNLLVLFVAASILSIIPISIGGIGVRELTFLYGLEFLGYSGLEDIGVTVAFLVFIVYILTALIGLPILYVFKHTITKAVP